MSSSRPHQPLHRADIRRIHRIHRCLGASAGTAVMASVIIAGSPRVGGLYRDGRVRLPGAGEHHDEQGKG